MKTIVKGLIGLQDISRGFGTFQRSTSTGGTQTMNQLSIAANAEVFVGDDFATYWGSSEIGAQINAAYLALPSTGGTIRILPSTAGANGSQPYTWTTPIIFGVAGKYVRLLGAAPANQSNLAGVNNSQGGATLNWTGTTGGTSLTLTGVAATVQDTGVAVYSGSFPSGGSNAYAGKIFQVTGFAGAANNGYFVCTASTTTTLTLANGLATLETHAGVAQMPTTAMTWANDTGSGGDGYAVANSMEDICLVNAAYSGLNNGGNSYCTVGLNYSGAGRLQTKNLRIGGFGVGRMCIEGAGTSVGWGAKDFNMSLAWNNVGSIFHNCQEQYSWFGGQLAVNAIGIQLSGTLIVGADVNLHGVSVDGNTVYGFAAYSGLGTQLTFNACHFENAGGTNLHYGLVQSAIGSEFGTHLMLSGCQIVDDVGSGSTDYMFNIANGSNNQSSVTSVGNTFASAGRSSTIFVIGAGSVGFLQGTNSTPAKLTNYSGNNVTSFINTQNPIVIQNGIQVGGGVTTTTGLFNGASTQALTGSFANIGLTTNSSEFILRDNTVGGTVKVTVDNTATSIVLSGAAGAAAFVVGAPGSNQIGLQYSGGFLQIQGNGTRVGDSILFQQQKLA